MKKSILLFLAGIILALSVRSQQVVSGRMNEVFLKATDLATGVSDPWEIIYGPDDSLWITESKAYTVTKMGKNGGTKRIILNIARNATFLPLAERTFNLQFNYGSYNAQGGLAGLAIHPEFMNDPSKKFVYVSYIHKFVQDLSVDGPDPGSVADSAGIFFTNQIVRFTYNPITGILGNPVSLCDTLPGSNDHNSQRMIIAPVNGVNYLFYAAGDMGAGQFKNKYRINHSQDSSYYEGKILRFNLDSTGSGTGLDKWIPNDNPYSNSIKNAVWATGMRNNQGFAYDSVRNILYGSAHGPYSDDEINIVEGDRNYGHPIVVGYSSDNNYNNSSIGTPGSSAPLITSETGNAALIGARYKDPLFSAYGASQSAIGVMWSTQPPNGGWPSEGWSGLGLYNYSAIPGWKNSLLAASLKWGRVLRIKLGPNGTTVVPINGSDTVSYFGGRNRFRDMAFAPDGKTIYVVMDNSTTSSGPSQANPVVPSCAGCIQKYTFLGYNTVSGTSALPNSIEIGAGKANACENLNTVTINAANNNNNIWVPITDTLGNIIAEIDANSNNLGNVTSSVYVKTGAVREFGFYKTLYANRSITITPQNAPGSAVNVRLYLTNAEYIALRDGINSASQSSGIGSITNVGIFKNNETPCSSTMSIIPTSVPTVGVPYTRDATTGYVIEVAVTGFSTFYFANSASTLPLRLLSFKGALSDETAKLQWLTENESGTKSYIVERSVNGKDFDSVGTIASKNVTTKFTYYFSDVDVRKLNVPVVYYRLKMTDANAQYSYSDVVKLNVSLIAGTISVRPNPVISDAVVDIYSTITEKASWILTDINGKTVMQRSLNLKKGENSLNINLSSLPVGMYYLKVSGNTINQAIKLQKL